MNIDWSKAPEWADGHGLMVSGFGIEEVWFDTEQYMPVRGDARYGPYPYGGYGNEHQHNLTRKSIRFETTRPEPWNGEGLPPVGRATCEYLGAHQYDVWTVVNIFAHWGDQVFVDYGDGWRAERDLARFRPIRTAEQIAEEARIAELNLMIAVIKDHPGGRHGVDHLTQLKIHEEACINLYDSGWRRQVES